MSSKLEQDKFLVMNRKRFDEIIQAAEDTPHEGAINYKLKYARTAIRQLEDAFWYFNESYNDLVGKGLNQKYYVCNQDEPYAQEVINLILINFGKDHE